MLRGNQNTCFGFLAAFQGTFKVPLSIRKGSLKRSRFTACKVPGIVAQYQKTFFWYVHCTYSEYLVLHQILFRVSLVRLYWQNWLGAQMKHLGTLQACNYSRYLALIESFLGYLCSHGLFPMRRIFSTKSKRKRNHTIQVPLSIRRVPWKGFNSK